MSFSVNDNDFSELRIFNHYSEAYAEHQRWQKQKANDKFLNTGDLIKMQVRAS